MLKGIHLVEHFSPGESCESPLLPVKSQLVLGCNWLLNEHPGREGVLAEILDQNAVHVWCLDTERLSAREVASAFAVLSPEEQLRQRLLHFPEDRRDFALAHALLRHSLS